MVFPVKVTLNSGLGHPIGIHNFPHQLIRPPTTSVGSVPMFAIDSQRAVPVVSIAVSNKGIFF